MCSRIPNEARPVRMDAMSCCKSESAFSMRVLRLASTSRTEPNVEPPGAACCSVFIECLQNRAAILIIRDFAAQLTPFVRLAPDAPRPARGPPLVLRDPPRYRGVAD